MAINAAEVSKIFFFFNKIPQKKKGGGGGGGGKNLSREVFLSRNKNGIIY